MKFRGGFIMKKFLGLLLIFLFVFMGTVTAEITYKTITVELRNIQIYVNNQKINSEIEPFIFGGRTFVPVRMVAELFNKEVVWDGDANKIFINDKTSPTEKSETTETTVYVTKTGDKYHRSGCQYLSKSKIAISLTDAKSQGYSPCSKCKPPG
jgi:hypothetical protein